MATRRAASSASEPSRRGGSFPLCLRRRIRLGNAEFNHYFAEGKLLPVEARPVPEPRQLLLHNLEYRGSAGNACRQLCALLFLVFLLVLSALLVFWGSYIVTLVPKAMFAALLFTSGLNLLSDNLRSAWSDLQRREFLLVLMHIALTAYLGMLSAVVLGMLLTATIFIVQYSSHSGVLQSATSLLERSKVARTQSEQEILEQYGATVLIIHLHGMIFFGSGNSVLDEVKAHLQTLAELQLPAGAPSASANGSWRRPHRLTTPSPREYTTSHST